MSRYRTIDARIHFDAEVASLSRPKQANGYDLFHHLLIGPQVNALPGLFYAHAETLARELRWSVEDFLEVWDQEIARKPLAVADWHVGLVFLPSQIKYRAPANANMVAGWRDAWESLPECELKEQAAEAFRVHFVHRIGGELGQKMLHAFDAFARKTDEVQPEIGASVATRKTRTVRETVRGTVGRHAQPRKNTDSSSVSTTRNSAQPRETIRQPEETPSQPREINLHPNAPKCGSGEFLMVGGLEQPSDLKTSLSAIEFGQAIASANGMPNGSPNGYPTQDQEQDQEQELGECDADASHSAATEFLMFETENRAVEQAPDFERMSGEPVDNATETLPPNEPRAIEPSLMRRPAPSTPPPFQTPLFGHSGIPAQTSRKPGRPKTSRDLRSPELCRRALAELNAARSKIHPNGRLTGIEPTLESSLRALDDRLSDLARVHGGELAFEIVREVIWARAWDLGIAPECEPELSKWKNGFKYFDQTSPFTGPLGEKQGGWVYSESIRRRWIDANKPEPLIHKRQEKVRDISRGAVQSNYPDEDLDAVAEAMQASRGQHGK